MGCCLQCTLRKEGCYLQECVLKPHAGISAFLKLENCWVSQMLYSLLMNWEKYGLKSSMMWTRSTPAI